MAAANRHLLRVPSSMHFSMIENRLVAVLLLPLVSLRPPNFYDVEIRHVEATINRWP